ncbi:hypothetical protein M011DRAFT_463723 [Sporormia fimetaria CBS 119925]|uniref:Zn(2)-C6 fungal-type domain-containing protein n=1 Tax=Sporormia fimetaria CBS 119925 TaxID=1340428 RepID=A0A6A6VQ61_9PLEO|nr:hypothetical protein M011DRAFT_463723 [Sporormia fimetaria CBS 119925]
MSANFPTPSPSQAPSSSTGGGERRQKEQPRIRRRNRLITSCLECRRRKLKCDKLQPCTNCTKFNRDCLFIAPALDSAGQAKLAEVKEKMGQLERALEQDVARRGKEKSTKKETSTSGYLVSPAIPGQDESFSDQEDDEDVKGLEPTVLVSEDCAYFDNEADEDIVDLGIAMGKVRITERIGGIVRPRFSEELTLAFKSVQTNSRQTHPNIFAGQQQESWMSPGADYVAPSSGFFFAPGVQRNSATTYLPSRPIVDKLMNHYWKAVHVIARCVHRPTFERYYDRFWDELASGVEPRISFQAVLCAALLSAVISMSEAKVSTEFGVAKSDFVDNFKLAAESALARANFLRTTKLETLQAFVMYLIPLCRAEVSRAHSALTGSLIRLAECMSLHRDPSYYTSDPVEVHVRRLIWYQICFLDIRTCEATGPRPQIRREEHDVKFPLNVDDADLESGKEVTEDRKYFTEMTITRMRFECYEMARHLWIERPRLEVKKTTMTTLLAKIQRFCQAMEKTYLPMLQKTHPLHVLAIEIYGILTCKMYIMILLKYMSNEQRIMPERLRNILISTAIMSLEHGITLETTTALTDWAWYIGAMQQYHSALLLVSEIYATERDPIIEARVWRCLDFVFGLPADYPPIEKLQMVLGTLADRTTTYQSVRRMRAPKQMQSPPPRQGFGETKQEQSTTPAGPHLDRSGSSHSETSHQYSVSSGASPHQQQHLQQAPPMGKVTQMAQAEYGQFHGLPPAEASGVAMQNVSSEAHPYQTYVPTTVAHSQQVANTMAFPPPPPLQPQSSYDTSHYGAAVGVTGHSSAPGNSPIDPNALPDIDWNEWDQLFPATEMSIAGNLPIPPFTFPQLSPADLQLQWPTEPLH